MRGVRRLTALLAVAAFLSSPLQAFVGAGAELTTNPNWRGSAVK